MENKTSRNAYPQKWFYFFLISQILWNKNNKDVLHNKLYPLRSVHCSPERFELIFEEAETEVQGRTCSYIQLLGDEWEFEIRGTGCRFLLLPKLGMLGTNHLRILQELSWSSCGRKYSAQVPGFPLKDEIEMGHFPSDRKKTDRDVF